MDPALDDVVHLGRVGLLIECADEHEVEREMSAGRRLITVVQHGLVERRVTLHHHESIMQTSRTTIKKNRFSNK